MDLVVIRSAKVSRADFACSVALGSQAQTPQQGVSIPPEMRQEANDAYMKQDWNGAAEAYAKILKLDDSNVPAHYRFGLAMLNLNKPESALPHLEKAFSTSPNAVFALALARTYARIGNNTKTYEILDKSVKLGGIAGRRKGFRQDTERAAVQGFRRQIGHHREPLQGESGIPAVRFLDRRMGREKRSVRYGRVQ